MNWPVTSGNTSVEPAIVSDVAAAALADTANTAATTAPTAANLAARCFMCDCLLISILNESSSLSENV
jgi:hypothetical protein